MNAGQDHGEQNDVSEDEARAELERLLSDPRFHATNRGRSVLKYIAEQFFEGHTDGVKAYAIALDVLGRSHRFDPNSDPIVRIELSRLRSSLGSYYEAHGSEGDVSIELPVGRYVTVFTRTSARSGVEDDENAVPETAEIASPEETSSGPTVTSRAMMIALGVLGVGAFAVVAWWASEQPELMTERPLVSIEVEAADADQQEEADLLHDYLLTALSRFRTMTVAYQKDEPADANGADSHRHSYSIELKYYTNTSDRSVWWRALDKERGTVLASGEERVSGNGRSELGLRKELVSNLAREFGASRGIISNLETHDEPGKTVLGNTCVLRAELELNEGSHADVKESADCLERTLRRTPDSSDAAAVMARVLIDSEEAAVPLANLDRADALARQAIALDPMSDRAHVALMMVQFYRGNGSAAISAGNRAISLNPNNPEVLGKLALVLFSSGYRQGAISLAEDASRNVTTAPRDARLVLALNAYLEGNFSDASLIAEQVTGADAVIMALRAAALGEIGSPTSRERLDALLAVMPDYQTDLTALMNRRRYDPDLIVSLQKGLQKASQVNVSAN